MKINVKSKTLKKSFTLEQKVLDSSNTNVYKAIRKTKETNYTRHIKVIYKLQFPFVFKVVK